MQIGLLRHGETTGGTGFRGSTDDPLTPAGWAQMKSTIEQGCAWEQLISSPLLRCAAFANDLSRRHSLPLHYDNRLQEIHFGRWEGCSAAELMEKDSAALQRFWHDPGRYPPPDGESLHHFQTRVLAAWHDTVANATMRSLLIVTHGGVIRVLLGHIQRQPMTDWHQFDVPHGKLFIIQVTDHPGDSGRISSCFAPC